MKLSTILLIFFISVVSCNKKETTDIKTTTDGVVVSLPYAWKKSLHKNGVLSNGSIRTAIYYNNAIAIPTTNGANNRLITLINSENGETIWSWDDRYQPQTEDIFITSYYQHNNLVTYQNGKRSYCINLDNGNTQWKKLRNSSFDVRLYINKNNNFFYNIPFVNNQGYNEFVIYTCDINNGNVNEFVRANYSGSYISPNNSIGNITTIIKEPNSNMYAVTYSEPSPNWVVNTYLGLYNSDTQQWVYERKLMAPPTQNSSAYPPKIFNNRIYTNVGKNLVCHDITTGTQIWKKSFPQDFLFSGFIIAEGKIIATNEDTYTYCLDPNTGQILWKTETSGTSGRMSALNGIVYFVGGSSNKLHAIDMNSGEHVWKLDASHLENNSSGFKTNAVYVFSAANGKPAKVIALSHLYAYCFEAYQ